MNVQTEGFRPRSPFPQLFKVAQACTKIQKKTGIIGSKKGLSFMIIGQYNLLTGFAVKLTECCQNTGKHFAGLTIQRG